MALEGINGVKLDAVQKLDGTALEPETVGNIHGDGYKGETVSNEERIARAKYETKVQAEQKEMNDKGITDPTERAKYLMQKDIAEGRLVWKPEESALFGLVKVGGYYEYNLDDKGLYGVETANDIAQRYGFAPQKIAKDGNYVPSDGRMFDVKIKLKPEGMPLPAE